MPFEIWVRSTANPPVFEPERAAVPPFDDFPSAVIAARAYTAADREASVVERDEHGQVVPHADDQAALQAAHDAEASTGRTSDQQLSTIAPIGAGGAEPIGDGPMIVSPLGRVYVEPAKPETAAGAAATSPPAGWGSGELASLTDQQLLEHLQTLSAMTGVATDELVERTARKAAAAPASTP